VPRKNPNEITIYQLKATLDQSDPLIWRSFELRGDTSLDELHIILQVLFDWTNSHLHLFRARGIEYSDPMFEIEEAEDEADVTLEQVAPVARSTFTYEYDFGDSWELNLAVTKRFPADPDTDYPRLLEGGRAAPPDDVGGIWFYNQLAEFLRQPGGLKAAAKVDKTADWDVYEEWLPEGFDPDVFDSTEINGALHRRWGI
jgi:hypothetical protein